MRQFPRFCPRRLVSSLLRSVVPVLLLSVTTLAPQHVAADLPPLVVTEDLGGSVRERLATLRRLSKERRRVEIRGGQCLSACTLYLGLEQVCVAPEARFGFHGPSSQHYGISLPPAEFEDWSRRMAAAYPPPLRDWFLSEARHVTVGFRMVSGTELIGLGLARC